MVPREKITFCLNSVPDSTAREPVQGMGGGGVGGGGRKHTYYIVARGGGGRRGSGTLQGIYITVTCRIFRDTSDN